MNIAIIGATGLVGSTLIKIINEKKIVFEMGGQHHGTGCDCDEYFLFASEKSRGKQIEILSKSYTVNVLSAENIKKHSYGIAFFMSSALISREFAPLFLKSGCVVIDNSSCFRMDSRVPLAVPPVNGGDILKHRGLIANPNCTTIPLVEVLSILNKNYSIKRCVVSTYQAVSGAGYEGIEELRSGMASPCKKFPVRIYSNCIPRIDNMAEDGYTKEENKIIEESRKILGVQDLRITATAVRVPVFNCHAESVNVELEKSFFVEDVFSLLSAEPFLKVYGAGENIPTSVNADGNDLVHVGRLRRDYSVNSGLNLWIVSDNLRVGAAANALDTALFLLKNRSLFRQNMALIDI